MQDDAPVDQAALLTTADLAITVAGRRLVDALHLTVHAGQFIAVLGPNGVGKTLTLLTLAGLREADRGDIHLGGTRLRQLSRPVIARRLGLMLQHQTDPFPTSVLETTLLGRHARNGIWGWETSADRRLARDTLERVDLAGFEGRTAATLSGGERRRLALATLLMQDPQLLLLDEPLNHLDPQHRFAVLACLTELCAGGKAVIASLHDPMLAAQYASHVLLLHGDGSWFFGPSTQLLNQAHLEALYDTPFVEIHHGTRQLLMPVAPDNLTPGRSAP
ncbi:MAG: ABC transporter ATP-binding protein [Gammaproteobacteria bacterium]